ncbi:MAG: DUF6146 family protein [Flavobacteriaceae bacterium]|nr:DUF6146 family protein [Flavobacteriaceae bacterium]
MKNLIYFLSIIGGILIISCGTPKKTVATTDNQKEEPVRIANDSLEYEIIIIDIGFNLYLNTIAQPMNYYSQSYLETRNRVYVIEWNIRAQNLIRFDPNIYENIIDYQPHIDYGLEVNYKLFNYFQFAQRKYKMRLGNFRVDG